MFDILTIGHSDHEMSVFLKMLSRAGVKAVADVRSVPYSRRHPQFSRDALPDSLAAVGIDYLFLGRELGARPQDRSCWCNGSVDFGRLAATPLFKDGLSILERAPENGIVAMMCAERDPATCHRTILVARELEKRGLSVGHINPDGSIDAQRKVMLRLSKSLKVAPADMFRCEGDVLQDTYAIQSKKIAFSEF